MKNVLCAIAFFLSPNFLVAAPIQKATFAGGCFWCMEVSFEELDGVESVISGFAGGSKKNPTYAEVSSGKTKYLEVVQVSYDPSKITYKKLLEVFWRSFDPTDDGGQFKDRGNQYRSAIFYHTPEQKREAKESKQKLSASKRFNKPIVTEIRPFTTFFPAEKYHQDYYKKNPKHYKQYRKASGRDAFLDETWGKEKQ